MVLCGVALVVNLLKGFGGRSVEFEFENVYVLVGFEYIKSVLST